MAGNSAERRLVLTSHNLGPNCPVQFIIQAVERTLRRYRGRESKDGPADQRGDQRELVLVGGQPRHHRTAAPLQAGAHRIQRAEDGCGLPLQEERGCKILNPKP